MYTLGIITSSDKGSRGEREDKSGEVIKNISEENDFEVKRYVVLPEKCALQVYCCVKKRNQENLISEWKFAIVFIPMKG